MTLIVIAASAWMNFEYMTGEGSGRAALLLGVISVALDLIKALLPIVIAAALIERAWLRAAVASVFLMPLVAFSFVSALGFGESNKGDRVTGREALAAELRDAERDLDAARLRLLAGSVEHMETYGKAMDGGRSLVETMLPHLNQSARKVCDEVLARVRQMPKLMAGVTIKRKTG